MIKETSVVGRAVEFTTVDERINDKVWDQIEEILIDNDNGYLLEDLFDYPEMRDCDGQPMTLIAVRLSSADARKIIDAMRPGYKLGLTLIEKEEES